MKQGGVSWNRGSQKRGIIGRHRCKICGREYKQIWTLENHESGCKLYNGRK